MLAGHGHHAAIVIPERVLHPRHLELRQDLPALLLVEGHTVLAAEQQSTGGAPEVHPVRAGMWRGTLLGNIVGEVLDQNLDQKSVTAQHRFACVRGTPIGATRVRILVQCGGV